MRGFLSKGMFTGHYAASFALKRMAPRSSLLILMLGVQFVDILFMIFINFGIERMRLVPGFTESNALKLDFMPYTHSLLATVIWAALAFLAARAFLPATAQASRNLIAGAIALSVLSHYFLDIPVHTPDLPLAGDDTTKLGLGLWNNRTATIILETFLVGASYLLYLGASKPGPGFAGKFGMHIFAGVLLIMGIVQYFLPPPPSILLFSAEALFSYVVLALVGGWLDTKRVYA